MSFVFFLYWFVPLEKFRDFYFISNLTELVEALINHFYNFSAKKIMTKLRPHHKNIMQTVSELVSNLDAYMGDSMSEVRRFSKAMATLGADSAEGAALVDSASRMCIKNTNSILLGTHTLPYPTLRVVFNKNTTEEIDMNIVLRNADAEAKDMIMSYMVTLLGLCSDDPDTLERTKILAHKNMIPAVRDVPGTPAMPAIPDLADLLSIITSEMQSESVQGALQLPNATPEDVVTAVMKTGIISRIMNSMGPGGAEGMAAMIGQMSGAK